MKDNNMSKLVYPHCQSRKQQYSPIRFFFGYHLLGGESIMMVFTILEPLLRVTKAYPNAKEIITIAKIGPVRRWQYI